jgi:hypothetical protein
MTPPPPLLMILRVWLIVVCALPLLLPPLSSFLLPRWLPLSPLRLLICVYKNSL